MHCVMGGFSNSTIIQNYYSHHTGILPTNVILILALFVATAGGAPVWNTNEPKAHSMDVFDGQELFEGDLKISEEMIRRYYNITDFEKTTGKKFHLRTLKAIPPPTSFYKITKLTFWVIEGHYLPDKDGWWNKSDPYVYITFYSHDGISIRTTTSTQYETLFPFWNESFKLGIGEWKEFKIRAWDNDLGNDDPLSDQETVTFSDNSHTDYLRCYRGYIKYSYMLSPLIHTG